MFAVIPFPSRRTSTSRIFAHVEGEAFPAHVAALVASAGEQQADAMRRLREIVQKLERSMHCIRYLIANVEEQDVQDALAVNANIVDELIKVVRETVKQVDKRRL